MNFFLWTFDWNSSECWFLGEPRSSDGCALSAYTFNRCREFVGEKSGISVAIERAGQQCPASFGAFDIIYVSPTVAFDLKKSLGAIIQFIEVSVHGAGSLYILNALTEVCCIDETKSEFQKWEVGNDIRPDKEGQYRSFMRLVIDPVKAQGHEIFRPWGWHNALIVSERLKDSLQSMGVECTSFQSVT